MTEVKKRQIAYKLRIGDVLKGKPILDESPEQQRFLFLELGDKKIVRVNFVANVIDKYSNEGAPTFGQDGAEKKKYSNLTLDDASGQIKLKIFGDDVAKFNAITQGNTVIAIGTLRFYNNEIYLSPEIIKVTDPRYLLVRKLELDQEKPTIEVKREEITAIKDRIIDMIKKSEDAGGIETEKMIMELNDVSPEIINQEIKKMLEEGLVYEPRPGKVRYLG